LKSRNRLIPLLAAIALAAALPLTATPAAGQPGTEAGQAIRYLIDRVATAPLTFVRNGDEYTAAQAAQHLQRKYRHYRDAIETPEDFIELCASRSLASGSPYQVIDSQGHTRPTGEWLRSELAAYPGHSR